MRTSVLIIEMRIGEPVEATLFDEIQMEHFLEAQAEWRPVVIAATR